MRRLRKDAVISAQVVLRPAGRQRIGQEPITSANVQEILPLPDTVSRATTYFANAGFVVGPCVGNSFAITGAARIFEKVFGGAISQSPQGGVESLRADRRSKLELPMERLPAEVASLLEAVTFTTPPDFGPTGYR